MTGVKLQFAHDVEVALIFAAALVNTREGGVEQLTDPEALAAFAAEREVTGTVLGTAEELEAVCALRPQLAVAWDPDASEEEVVAVVNDLLTNAAMPHLTRHDGWDWHLHLTTPDAPLADRLGAEAAMAIAELVRVKDLDRLKRCGADDCTAVLVDLSRNRSRRYCTEGNCGNRAHVAAYRARKAAGASPAR